MAIFKKKATKKEEKTENKVEEKKESMKSLYEKEQLKKSVKTKKSDSRYTGAYRVLIKPLVTEKATALGVNNKYVFIVNIKTNKLEVAKAIYAVYGVKPVAVNIVKMKGKAVTRGRIKGKRKDFKKAIVTLAKDQQIQVYEGV
jgi:large subunit ribosomal protein L23